MKSGSQDHLLPPRARAHRDKTSAGVTVSDDGPGIAPAEQQAVLRRFYRGEASRHTPGSGLGLSLALAVAGMHGMSIRFNVAAPGCEVLLYRPTE